MTDAGLVPIRDIHPDIHRAWARDEVSGETGWKDVLAHYANRYGETLFLTVFDPESGEEQTITLNRIHPFFAQTAADPASVLSVGYGGHEHENGEWIEAQNLAIGQRLYAEDGTWDIVSDLKIEPLPLKAFNLTVDDFHTYFVAQSDDDTPLWVHNDCFDKVTFKLQSLPKERQIAVTDTINHIRSGTKPSHKEQRKGWEKPFKNEKRKGKHDLPTKDKNNKDITYQEYRVLPRPGQSGGGTDRIVVGSDGRVYYTGVHYGNDKEGKFLNIEKPFQRIF